jgi:hypothetical protein
MVTDASVEHTHLIKSVAKTFVAYFIHLRRSIARFVILTNSTFSVLLLCFFFSSLPLPLFGGLV